MVEDQLTGAQNVSKGKTGIPACPRSNVRYQFREDFPYIIFHISFSIEKLTARSRKLNGK